MNTKKAMVGRKVLNCPVASDTSGHAQKRALAHLNIYDVENFITKM